MSLTLNVRRTAIAFEAAALLTAHGLSQQGWAFAWNSRKRAFGLCDYRARTIELSTPLFALASAESSADTLRHELAHAIAPRGAGHGPLWRAACRRVGANPVRCKTAAQAMSPEAEAIHVASFKYTATCRECDYAYGAARMPRLGVCCGRCHKARRVFVPFIITQNR